MPASATVTRDLPLYTVVVTADAGVDTVVIACAVTHKFDPSGDGRRNAGCQVLGNGMGGDNFPLVSNYGGPYTPHTSSQVVNGSVTTTTLTVVRSVVTQLIPPTQTTFHVRVFDTNSAVIVHVDLEVDLPSRPVPSLKTNTIPRSLFQTSVPAQAADVTAFRAAGINCLEYGLFQNPADGFSTGGGGVGAATLAGWKADMAGYIAPVYDWARANGFLLFLAGDSFFRSPDEKSWIKNTSWAHDAVTWLMAQVATYSDVVVGIEMQDESPDTGTDLAYQLVVDWIREVWPDAPISWPTQNWDGIVLPNEVPSRASYASRFVAYDGLLPYAVPSVGELEFRYRPASANTPDGWPVVLDLSGMGPVYTKGGPGGDYNPATDTLDIGGLTPESIVASVWIALARGCCALRCYAWDGGGYAGRLATPVGNQFQTGIRAGDARWSALSAAYNSVGSREAKLLAGFRPPQQQGPWLLGFRDELNWAVNVSSRSEPCAPGNWRLVIPGGEVDFAGGGSVPSGGVIIGEDD
jgi:hypothetical protein